MLPTSRGAKMEILNYTEEHDTFRTRLQNFLKDEVIPYVDQWESEKLVPKEVWIKMGKAGFLCTAVSEQYGGLGKNFLYSVIVAEELSKTHQQGLMANLHSDVIVPYIESFGSGDLKSRYLPGCVSGEILTAVAMTEPDAGSDLASMATSAEEVGGDIIINGSKTFISNGINCDIVIVAAKDPNVENPHQGISLYIVEDGTPGFNKGNQLDKMGMHSQDTAELFFTNCKVPKTNRIGTKGAGFKMLMQKLQQERLVCSLFAQFSAERILESTLEYIKKPSHSMSQSIQFALVETAAEIKIGRTFVDKLVADHIENRNVAVETSMAKFWTTEMAQRVADSCMNVLGETATLEDCPIVRLWRDTRPMAIFAGTNEIMKGIIAKFLKI